MKVIQTMAISLRRLTEKVSQRLKGIKDGSEKIPPRRLFQLVLVLYVLGIFALVLAIHYTSPMQQVVRRYAGFHKYVGNSTCSPANATMYQYGTCTKLIECLFDPLDPLSQNDIAIGAALLGLFPTILILVASPASELVPMALVSPHRALATAAFSIGTPLKLLSQLSPLTPGFKPRKTETKRIWSVSFAAMTETASKRHLAVKLVADIIIGGVTAIVLWQYWIINGGAMNQWKCESPLLVFLWPVSCILWMVFAVLLLLAFQKSIRFENAARSHHQYSWSEAIFLPYTLDIHQMGGSPWCCMRRQKQASGIDCLKCLEEKSKATIDQARHSVQQTDTAGQLQQQNSRLNEQMSPGSVDPQKEKDTCEKEVDEFCLRIIVCMPSGTLERLVMNWEMYDLIIEIFGVAIYFYATFVMMTLLFVASVPALRFIALVAGSYIGVRAVGLVF